MAQGTNISWCDDTWNPWRGCTKISAGCANCYAETWGHRFGVKWGPGEKRQRASESYLRQPFAWNKRPWVCKCGNSVASPLAVKGSGHYWCDKCGAPGCSTGHPFHRRRVFCGSLMDWLDPEVKPEWLAALLDTIRQTPELTWLMLSKREWLLRIAQVLDWLDGKRPRQKDDALYNWLIDWLEATKPPSNIWIGASVEDQETADERIPELLRIPAAKRFLNIEPLIGLVDLDPWLNEPKNHRVSPARPIGVERIDWVICGGESGNRARPCKVDWIRSIVSQCKVAGVAVFVKQMGRRCLDDSTESNLLDMIGMSQFGDREGRDPSEWPPDLRVQEYPA